MVLTVAYDIWLRGAQVFDHLWELVTSGFPIRSTNTLGVYQDPTHTAVLSSQMIHCCL